MVVQVAVRTASGLRAVVQELPVVRRTRQRLQVGLVLFVLVPVGLVFSLLGGFIRQMVGSLLADRLLGGNLLLFQPTRAHRHWPQLALAQLELPFLVQGAHCEEIFFEDGGLCAFLGHQFFQQLDFAVHQLLQFFLVDGAVFHSL